MIFNFTSMTTWASKPKSANILSLKVNAIVAPVIVQVGRIPGLCSATVQATVEIFLRHHLPGH